MDDRLRKKAAEAKRFIFVRLSRAGRIDLVDVGRGARFRIVARWMVDGKDLGAELLAAGLAKPAGTSRPKWCKA